MIDNGIDYWRCDLGGAAFPNNKVIGGYDYYGQTGPSICLGTCRFSDDGSHGLSNHGTQIAAIIGAYTNNYGCGASSGPAQAMAGIAGGWGTVGGATNLGTGVSLLGYNVIDHTTCGPLTQGPRTDWAASAIMESAVFSVSGYYRGRADVINASWYGPPYPLLGIRSAVSEAFRNGVSFVACTGNHSSQSVVWPANIEPASEVISVGAATKPTSGPSAYVPTRATYSNNNHYTDLVAPGGGDGTDQVFALQDDALDVPTSASGYADAGANEEGTSFATPHVAGVTALLRDYLQTGGYMGDPPQGYLFEDIEGILKASALDFGDPATDPWCCPHYDGDILAYPHIQYQVGFDEQVGWGFLQAGQMFNMLDPAGQGYQIYHLITPCTTYTTWSTTLQPITIYDPSGQQNPPPGQYKAYIREASGTISYSSLHLSTSVPVYAWGNSALKGGWANLTPVGGVWSNWQELWGEIEKDTHVPPRDFGNGIVPGIRHDYSTSFIVHTYQYDLWNTAHTVHYGIYPAHISPNTLYVQATVFGIPCPGCKIADGHPASALDTTGIDVTVHPNPASSMARICVADLPGGIPAIVEVVNESGQVIATLYDATPDGELGLCLTLDCSKLPSGIYYSHVSNAIMGRAVKLSIYH